MKIQQRAMWFKSFACRNITLKAVFVNNREVGWGVVTFIYMNMELEPKAITPDSASTDTFERFPNEELFNNFTSSLKDIEVSEEEDSAGKKVRYATLADLTRRYNQVFTTAALTPGTLSYRVKTFIENNPEDENVQKIESERLGATYEPKYFVNIANKEILKKIFLPTIDADSAEIAKEVQELENSRINHARFDEVADSDITLL